MRRNAGNRCERVRRNPLQFPTNSNAVFIRYHAVVRSSIGDGVRVPVLKLETAKSAACRTLGTGERMFYEARGEASADFANFCVLIANFHLTAFRTDFRTNPWLIDMHKHS